MKVDIDEKLRMLAPRIGSRKAIQLRRLYFVETDPRAKREIESLIDMKVAQLVKKDIQDTVILPPPAADICQGDINIGQVQYLDQSVHPFHLRLSDINRHMVITGASGSGKTTCALHLIRQLHRKKVPFLLIDWEQSYRSLAKEFDDVEVFTVGTDVHPIHINILELPPGIGIEEYIKSLIALISEDYLSGAGSDTMFLNYLKTTFDEFDKPTFEHLKQVILRELANDRRGRGKLSGRSGLWKETVQRIIIYLSLGSIANVLNANDSYRLPELLNRNVILEFGGVKSPRDRKFLIHAILNWISIYLQAQGILEDQMNNAIVFEEFHNISMKGKEDNLISQMFRESRKYGLGLVAIDQYPSQIPGAILANTNVKICFALSLNQDFRAMAGAMNLPYDKARYLGMLKTGEAIVNVKQRSPDAFMIKPPFIKQGEFIGDAELRALMARSFQPIPGRFRLRSSIPPIHTLPDHQKVFPLLRKSCCNPSSNGHLMVWMSGPKSLAFIHRKWPKSTIVLNKRG